jgi:hypothetical protein
LATQTTGTGTTETGAYTHTQTSEKIDKPTPRPEDFVVTKG